MAPVLPIPIETFLTLEVESQFDVFSKVAAEFVRQLDDMTESEQLDAMMDINSMLISLPTDYMYAVSCEDHLLGLSYMKKCEHWTGNECCFANHVPSPEKKRLRNFAVGCKCPFIICNEEAEKTASAGAEEKEVEGVAAEAVEEVEGVVTKKKKKKNTQKNKNKNQKKKKKQQLIHVEEADDDDDWISQLKTQPNSPLADSPPDIPRDSPPDTPLAVAVDVDVYEDLFDGMEWSLLKTQPSSPVVLMSDNLTEKVISLDERLKISGTEYGQKMTAGVSSMSFKMKEFFQGPNQADKIVEEATAETLDEPDWATNLEICDLVNQEKINSIELIRGIKKRIMLKNPRIQYLSLMLLETVVKNCEKAFSEVASERVLDEIVKLVDDPQTVVNNRNKALMLIESWGEFSNELRYLPVFEETYKSLRSRGIQFPGRDDETLAPIFTPPRSVSEAETNATLAQRDIPEQTYSAEVVKVEFDVARNRVELLSTVLSSSPKQDVLQDDLTTTLVQQCRESRSTIMRIIETAGDNEAFLFEALSVNDEIQKALSKYDMEKPSSMVASALEPAMIHVAVEPDESPRAGTEDALVRKSGGGGRGTSQGGQHDDMMDDLDEMIFGNKSGTTTSSGGGVEPKKPD